MPNRWHSANYQQLLPKFGLEFVRAYFNDLLVMSKDTFKSHLIHLEEVFRIENQRLKTSFLL
jgi:hypothetical protein